MDPLHASGLRTVLVANRMSCKEQERADQLYVNLANVLQGNVDPKAVGSASGICKAAEAAGFESVEAYQSALDSVRPEPSVQQPEALSDMETIAGAATNTTTGQPQVTPDTRKMAREVYTDSKEGGKAHDYAMGEALEALFDEQVNRES